MSTYASLASCIVMASLCVGLLAGCGEKDIRGQMFIVTASRQTIMLSLNPIQLIEEKVLLEQVKSQAADTKQAFLDSRVSAVQARLAQSKAHADRAFQNQQSLVVEVNESATTFNQQVDRLEALLNQGANVRSTLAAEPQVTLGGQRMPVEAARSRILALARALEQADAQLTAANTTVSKDEADLTEALERRREFDPLERFLVSLPTPLQAIKTDAQGKFSFKAPGGVYFLLARATRAVVGPQENYVWVLKVDTRSQSQDVLLTNDNQIQTGCDSCLPWPPR